MNILVDTSIWSLALRRSGTLTEEDQFLVLELSELINEVRVVMIGPVRQELLSGISSHEQYFNLKKKLHSFEDLLLTREYYERAAEFYNLCRKNGVQGSQIDFLICATAAIAKIQIFTSDKDFFFYAKHVPITLYQPTRNTYR